MTTVARDAMLRLTWLRACQQVAEGSDDWEALTGMCSATAAVGALRREMLLLREVSRKYDALRAIAEWVWIAFNDEPYQAAGDDDELEKAVSRLHAAAENS